MKHLLLLLAAISLPLLAEESPSMDAGTQGNSTGIGAFAGLGKDRPKGARTEITASEEANWDNSGNVAEFVGRVVVRDPQFTLTCDRLRVVLRADRKGLESAEATGNVVIVQEQTEGTNQPKAIGRAGQATYIPSTGDVTLRKWPSVQQGPNTQAATEEGTVMILNRNGRSVTRGGSKTVITDTSDNSSLR